MWGDIALLLLMITSFALGIVVGGKVHIPHFHSWRHH